MPTATHSNNPSPGRRVMRLYLHTGLGLTALMLLVGLVMRAAQSNWVPGLSPGTFYALLTLHGAGMAVGLALCGMGGLWFLMRRYVDLSAPLAVLALTFTLLGVVGVLIATVFGHFAGLYTFLYPMPFDSNWPNWATGLFLISMVLVNLGWMIWCLQMVGSVVRMHGGLLEAMGWDYVFHPKAFKAAGRQPPPPEAFPALMVGLDGLAAGMTATLLVISLLVRWVDPRVQIDPLWAKNLTYFWAHTYANLIIYMLAAMIYVGLPYVTRREYHTSTVLVIGWWTSMTLTLTNYFHHLYMDFVQPGFLQYVGELSSYLSALPVTAVTIFSALMLVWRSRTRWTLGAIFFYMGLVGWVVGGIGAEIDASVPFNVHLHNTLWVPAHFHTYMLGGCLLFVMGWIFLLLESRSQRNTPESLRWVISVLTFGGMTVFLMGFYWAGALGVPRRYATEPLSGPLIAQIATVGAVIMLVGFILIFIEGLRLRRSRQADRPLWPEEIAHQPHE
jgi:cytochrome c oxidase subunit 1